MNPAPEYVKAAYKPSGKLEGKVALITGGDSGIGRSVAAHYAREGADVAIVYLEEDVYVRETERLINKAGKKCLLIKGDVKDSGFCRNSVDKVIATFGKLNIMVNNAGMQFPQKDVKNITEEQLDLTFRTNIFAYFYFAEEALKHMQ